MALHTGLTIKGWHLSVANTSVGCLKEVNRRTCMQIWDVCRLPITWVKIKAMFRWTFVRFTLNVCILAGIRAFDALTHIYIYIYTWYLLSSFTLTSVLLHIISIKQRQKEQFWCLHCVHSRFSLRQRKFPEPISISCVILMHCNGLTILWSSFFSWINVKNSSSTWLFFSQHPHSY